MSASSASADPVTPDVPLYRVKARPTPVVVSSKLLPPPERRSSRFPFMPRLTRLTGWAAIILIIALLLGGGFGIFVSHGASSTNPFSLQVTPSSIAFGGILTLHGSHFAPHARIGLSRDGSIPIVDTGGSSFINAGASGSFSDTVGVDSSWTPGQHTFVAEDVHLHTSASFVVTITGHATSPLPAHLVLSARSVDIGSGDQTTNSFQSVTLFNAGGDEIDWKAVSTQPWLLLSPTNGIITAGQHVQVALAVDRTGVSVGSYSASVLFTSNIGQVPLAVKMQVTTLQQDQTPATQMAMTPAALSFSGVDGGASPASQVVTISNPGALPLSWSAFSYVSDGASWLSASPSSGIVAAGGAQWITVAVNSSQLLPGVYNGSITFAGLESAANSSQTLYVSVTIAPQCAIQVSPGTLSFSGTYLQPSPVAQTISVGTNKNCAAPLSWSVSASTVTGGKWLSVSAATGLTPASLSVGVTATGLLPGTYSGSLVFSAGTGSQTIPVILVIGKPAAAPILSATPALLSVTGVIGHTTSIPQHVVLSNSSLSILSWSAVAATTTGGAWLSVVPARGVLAARHSTAFTVIVTLLPALTPGTYTGSILITALDSTGNAAGSLTLPVTFIVQAPCIMHHHRCGG